MRMRTEKTVTEKTVTEKGAHGVAVRIRWDGVDWGKQDAVIAREEGCSRERVRQVRGALGKGRSPLWHRRPGSMREMIEEMSTECMTMRGIAETAGCRPSYALQCVSRAGKGYRRIDRRLPLKYDWMKADWTMTDEGVARALGVPNPGVVSQYRFRHGIWKRGPKANVGISVTVPAVLDDPMGGTDG